MWTQVWHPCIYVGAGADVDEAGLNETLELVKSKGVEAIARVTDVSNIDEVENLASQTFETFQNCHLLFNNAGVLGPAPLSQVNRDMYDWLININLGGCFNGKYITVPSVSFPLLPALPAI